MKWLRWFLAGALAVPLAHQILLAVLYAAGVVERRPFSFAPTDPFGIPSVVSLTFWGGVWGVILALVLVRMSGAGYWATALLFGAIAPTLVAFFVAAPLKGQTVTFSATMAAVGLAINGVWGLATAAIARATLRLSEPPVGKPSGRADAA